MIRPEFLRGGEPYGSWQCSREDVWRVLQAAVHGDVEVLDSALSRDPALSQVSVHGTTALQLAVREGRGAAVERLLIAGADPAVMHAWGEDLCTLARDRGHDEIAEVLVRAIRRRQRVQATTDTEDHEIHGAAESGDASRVRELLDSDPRILHHLDAAGGTPLHRAVAAGRREIAELLLDRGADVRARHGNGKASPRGYPAVDFEPIDLALWRGVCWRARGDFDLVQLLLERGAGQDLVVTAAIGDVDRVLEHLREDPARVHATRPNGRRPLSAAVQFGRHAVVDVLLEHGVDPNWPEGSDAPRGMALHAAARSGERVLVERLLAAGADPNADVESAGTATYAANSKELRAILVAAGGHLDPYDLLWLNEDEEAIRRVSADPASAEAGCGSVFAAACTLGKIETLDRLLAVGARVPAVVTDCRSYLWESPECLRRLLDSGMDPNLPDWQHATPLHSLCSRDGRGRPRPHRETCARMLLAAGADLERRDEDSHSTPLAWAARFDLPDMVELLLEHGASVEPGDAGAWTAPRAWAERRGNTAIAERLQRELT